MELQEALRRRRMVRSFSPDPLDPAVVATLVDDALRGPSAGNARGTAWVVLTGDETATYWSTTTTADWRARSRRWPGLSRAPVVAVALASPEAYVTRYGEADKADAGLGPADEGGRGATGWPVPYWFGDTGSAVMALLLGAVDAGLGACFLGAFRGEAALLEATGVPTGWRLYGAVLLGRPDGADHRSRSLDRSPDRAGRVHWGGWDAGSR